ncbi:unnamed protein product [Phytophthora fragariaefolia]|uniref:Unnamed protein product n=1 Tax=Phytophthora fragariaefolia TaxID=1490495 RepID=A0A9W6X8N6_9STRA|nr:unnamed protein product [Phytophthora fragariaefolia]
MRVRAIADVLRDSLLLKDALRVVAEQFEPDATPFSNAGDNGQEVAAGPTLVGYGLGSFCASSNAVHQLGFLLALKEALDAGETTATATAEVAAGADSAQHRAEIFDPAMNQVRRAATLLWKRGRP